MKTINMLFSVGIKRYKDKYYLRKTIFFDELSKHFKLNMYTNVLDLKEKDKSLIELKTNNIKVIHFNFNKKNVKSLQERKKDELFMIYYPVRSIDIPLCFWLKSNTIVWVKANPVDYELSPVMCYQLLKPFYGIIKAIPNLFYKMFAKHIFKNKLIFYTGHININRKNNFNQYSVVSSSIKTEDINYDKKEINKKIIYVGGISKQKGIYFLIKAMFKLKDKNLTIVGDGKFPPNLFKLIEKSNNITSYGPEFNRKKLLEEIKKSDVLIMPSLEEKQGKVTLEAMSQGTVTIATDVGGVSTVVKNNYNGLLIKPASSEEIVKVVNKIFNNHRLYQKLQKNGYKTAERFTLENQVDFMAEVINNTFK